MILKDALKEERFAFFDKLSILLECLGNQKISCESFLEKTLAIW